MIIEENRFNNFMFKFRKISAVSLFFFVFFIGCSPFKPLRIESIQHSSSYDELFPYHIEVCALSRIKDKNGFKGSRAGHGVLFLEGACRDTGAAFPQIKMCSKEDPQIESESGVGISVNKIFRNVNWVAVPGQNLFFYGNLQEEETLTGEIREAVVTQAIEQGIFQGIEIHEKYLKTKPAEESLEEFIARKSLGTDYALRFGRSTLCMKIPITRSMMEEIVSYLNRLNQSYALTEKEFHWDALSDNCTHTIYNALASVNMVSPRQIRAGKVRQFFNSAIPAHAVTAMTELASPDPLDDIRKIAKNHKQRTTLLKYHWLPMRHGTLLSALPVHQDNHLYEADSHFETLILRTRTFKSRRRLLTQAFSDKRFTDLKTNLNWFAQQYETILNHCRSERRSKKIDSQFFETYCRYIETQLNDVRKKLELL